MCLNGHRAWEPTNHHFWFADCARQLDLDGVFYDLRNKATDETYERDEVRLLTPAGPYEDAHREGPA